MKREMAREEAADRLTQIYEMIHYAKVTKCTSAAISEEYYDKTKDAIEMAIDALKSEHKMTNREYLIKLLESGDEKIVQYLNCSACAYDENHCKIGDKCALGVLKFLNAEREQKKGKWIYPSQDPEIVNKEFFSDCSVCGFASMNEYKYCPNCGAYMETDK